MTRDELSKLEGTPPVLMPDGKMGVLIRWPKTDDGECGFQVPGEPDIRWYKLDRVIDAGNGALIVQPGIRGQLRCQNCGHEDPPNSDDSCSAYGYNGVDCQMQPCICRTHKLVATPENPNA